MDDGPGQVITRTSVRTRRRLRRPNPTQPVRGPRACRKALKWATLAAVAAGVLFRVVRYAGNWPLWGDEAFVAVSLLTRDYAGLARPLAYFQITPVGFLWVEKAVVSLLGAGEWALRLVPFLAGLASLGLFWRFATATLGRRAAWMAMGLFAASFYPIRHATEVKPYATDLLLALGLTMLAHRAWLRPRSGGAWLGLTGLAAAGVWASYPLVFVVGGIGLALGWRAWREGARARLCGLGFLVATLASWAVMYVLTARPQALAAPFYRDMPTWEDSFPPVARPWWLPWWLLKVHAGNMMAYPYGANNFGSLATLVLVAFGSVVLWKWDRGLLGLLLAPLLPAFAAAAIHRYPYGTSARIALYLAPAICLLAGQGLAAGMVLLLPRRRARRALAIVSAGLAGACVVAAAVAAAMPYKDRIDLAYRDLVRDLAAKARPGDRWIGFNGLDDPPRISILMLMPWLAHAAQFHFYALRDAPVPLAWSPDPAAPGPDPEGRTWFLLHSVGFDRFPYPLFEAHLRSLTGRFGRPEVETHPMTGPEAVTAFVFPPRRR